jgi:ATP-binding cassette subfamily F protein uup
LVLVTHDRYLIDRISTSILALDGRGNAEYFADYQQWESNRPRASAPPRESPVAKPRPKRLSYKDQREYDNMEAAVQAAESRLAAATAAASDPAIAADAALLQQRFAEVTAAQAEVDRLYARWAELEASLN